MHRGGIVIPSPWCSTPVAVESTIRHDPSSPSRNVAGSQLMLATTYAFPLRHAKARESGDSSGPPPDGPWNRSASAPPAPQLTTTTPPAAAVATPEAKTDPLTTSSVPLPPARAAAAQASAGQEPAASTNEFGLDLGGAPTLDAIQQRWMTMKASFGPLLSGLHPLAAPERRQGKAGYRLVVGRHQIGAVEHDQRHGARAARRAEDGDWTDRHRRLPGAVATEQ